MSCHVQGSGKILVKPTQVKIALLYDNFTTIAKCVNEKAKDYYANISGNVDYISTKQGAKIQKNDIIIAIDQELAHATKTQAIVALESAELEYARNKVLLNKHFISTEALEIVRAQLEKAKLNFINNSNIYNDMMISAPFDGEIGVIKTKIGAKVKIGDYLFTIIKPGPKNIFLELPDTLYGKINQETEIFIKDENNNKVRGRIDAVAGYLSDNGTFSVKITAEDGNHHLVHGTYVNVELVLNKHKALAVPERAVMKNDKGNYLYQICKDNIVKKIYVKLGTRSDDLIEVINNDLKNNDLIILEGLTKVNDGSVVEILE
jgi:RND family efflux transporter MFP subunit